ncbi:peptidase [Streptomyces sp. NPDC002588]|uniref:peptidase n=1 Tax=Streptomyces sp. NPDC002588 TaxID=3154419 RepID=UPI00331D5167
MRRFVPAVVLVAAAFAAATSTSPSAATTTDPGVVGVRLVDIPASLADDPRAHHYIVDNLLPGTTIKRRVEVSNSSASKAHVDLYPGAAHIVRGAFVGESGRAKSELTTWTTLDHRSLDVPAHSTARATVTMTVPKDAAPGERYGVVWAQISGGRGGSITLVNRTGIRAYLSVGGKNPPPSDFTADTMTAERDASGRAVVLAQIHNTGGRALDLSGTLRLSKVSGSLSAGPYAVQLGTTLAPRQSEPVKVLVTDQVADGPWKATLELKSGLVEKTYHARITFPHKPGASAPSATWVESASSFPVLLGGLMALLLAAAVPIGVIRHRRRDGKDQEDIQRDPRPDPTTTG